MRLVRWRIVAKLLSIGFDVQMLCREVEERHELPSVLGQTFRGLWQFWLISFNEQTEGLCRILAGLGVTDVLEHFSGFWL